MEALHLKGGTSQQVDEYTLRRCSPTLIICPVISSLSLARQLCFIKDALLKMHPDSVEQVTAMLTNLATLESHG